MNLQAKKTLLIRVALLMGPVGQETVGCEENVLENVNK